MEKLIIKLFVVYLFFMRLLIYSFEKFHNLSSNPAYDVAKQIAEKFDSSDLELLQLPVTYDGWDVLRNKIDSFKPDFILGLGVAMGVNKVKVEKIALNYKHAGIPDNNG